MLELWKPLKTINSKPIIFQETGMYFDLKNYFVNYRPFIIFYSSNEHCYYYLKARDAYDKNGNPKFDPDLLENSYGEIMIKASSSKNSLFTKDSLVDCSQIFKINADLLEEIIDYDDILYKMTKPLKQEDILRIINGINQCVNEIPPYLSIMEVYSDRSYHMENNTFSTMYGDSVYLHPSKFENIKKQYFSGNVEIPTNRTIQDFAPTEEKLQEAYKFKTMFQEEYKKELNLINQSINESKKEYFEIKKSKSKNKMSL